MKFRYCQVIEEQRLDGVSSRLSVILSSSPPPLAGMKAAQYAAGAGDRLTRDPRHRVVINDPLTLDPDGGTILSVCVLIIEQQFDSLKMSPVPKSLEKILHVQVTLNPWNSFSLCYCDSISSLLLC